jgi:import inner membrane translocase subunit TIM50
MIDCDEKAVSEHRNNALVLPRWKGEDDDRTLFDLAALLQTIGTSELQDVRGVLDYYAKYQDPIAEFREKQKQLAELENSNKDLSPKLIEVGKTNPLSPAINWVYGQFKRQ